MKSKKELAQFGLLEAILSALMRVTLEDETAIVMYDKSADELRLKSNVASETVSTSGTNARAATLDFVERVMRPLVR